MQEQRPWCGFSTNSSKSRSYFSGELCWWAVTVWASCTYLVAKDPCTRLLEVQRLKGFFSQLAMPVIFFSEPSIAMWISIWSAENMYTCAWMRTAGHNLLYLHEEVIWQKAVALGCCRAGRVKRPILRLRAGEVWRLETQGVWRVHAEVWCVPHL